MMYKYTSYRQSYAEEGQLLVPEALYEPQISEMQLYAIGEKQVWAKGSNT